MEDVLTFAVQKAQQLEVVYTKYISSNDVGKTSDNQTRSHQAGFYISKSFLPYVFEHNIIKDNDYVSFVGIKWQNDFETQSRFKYYGSKNECHLTRLGKDFPYRSDENIGDLLIICKESREYYHAFVLQSDNDIDDFFAALNITSTNTNSIIPKQIGVSRNDRLMDCFSSFINSLNIDFPATIELATNARNCYNNANGITSGMIKENPDKEMLGWLNAEFQLFKNIENIRYSQRVQTPFTTVEELIEIANIILNRRKSRAGKSLEHHLAEVFRVFQLRFETQAVTEGRKKPDFLFPNVEAYLNPKFDDKKLVILASKTTCKDRWRQILNEADRVKTKHLFTLQQGISKNQLEEMYKYNVCLVVPKPYLKSFPNIFQDKILTLDLFVKNVQRLQGQ